MMGTTTGRNATTVTPVGNNFNLIRLLLAWLVIVEHSYALLLGDKYDPFHVLFGRFSSGYFAVNGFFVLSGFLITQSWLNDPSLPRYLMRRVARIVPGFLACVLICALLYLTLFDHSYLARFDWWRFSLKMLVLQAGGLPVAFEGTPYPTLNQSLWTIHYEFLCYLGLAALGFLGGCRNRAAIPLTIVILTAYLCLHVSGSFWLVLGIDSPDVRYYLGNWLRLSLCFLAGTLWALNHQRLFIVLKKHAAVAIVLVLAIMFTPLAPIAITVLLVPLLVVFGLKLRPLPGIWQRHDISYGIYLYAWPIQKGLVASVEGLRQPLLLILVTTLLACGFAVMSWLLVERPALRWLKPHR